MATPLHRSIFSTLIERFRHGGRKEPDTDAVKSFKSIQAEEGAYENRNRGTHTVKLDRIVGSVGRYQDFDSHFRFKTGSSSERLAGLIKVMREGGPLPPVKLYQIKDDYYVLDGNHRVAAAKHLGHDEILATIVEFIPSSQTLENLIYQERREFCEKTGLPDTLVLTESGQYDYLLKQIRDHQESLRQTDDTITVKAAAADWHETIVKPFCTIIQRGRLLDSFPERTLADLYAYISYCHWEKEGKRRYGIGIGKLIPKSMEEFRKKMAELKEFEYPEMKRDITAFVLVSVTGKKEAYVIEKLFALPEVVEVHAVHGDMDLLVKAVLTRDLLSSDAEIIASFVHERIRLLNGVKSTKTLIPGLSRIKRNDDALVKTDG